MHTTMTSCPPIDAPADVAEVRVDDVLDLGQVGAGQADERRSGVGSRERVTDSGGVRAGAEARVNRLEDPAVERHQVRHEGHRHAQFLLDLGAVAVPEHAVGGDTAVTLRKMRALARRLAGARHARLGVDDDARLEERRRDERLEREDGRRRITAGAGNQPRGRDGLPGPLGQPVGDVNDGGGRVRIPALPQSRTAQAKGAREIEHARAAIGQPGREFRGQGLGQREEHRVRAVAKTLGVEGLHGTIPDSGQGREPLRLGGAGGHRQPDIRMRVPGQPPEQLEPRVACRARHPHPYLRIFIHRKRLVIHAECGSIKQIILILLLAARPHIPHTQTRTAYL